MPMAWPFRGVTLRTLSQGKNRRRSQTYRNRRQRANLLPACEVLEPRRLLATLDFSGNDLYFN